MFLIAQEVLHVYSVSHTAESEVPPYEAAMAQGLAGDWPSFWGRSIELDRWLDKRLVRTSCRLTVMPMLRDRVGGCSANWGAISSAQTRPLREPSA